MQIQFSGRRQLAPNIWEYRFLPERPVNYEPGQYVDVRLPDVANDPRGAGRVFTLTSLPGEPELSFIVKHPSPQTPYKQHLEKLSKGAVASITDAMGDVILPKLPTIPLVFVAGGIGIASFVSILRYLEKTGQSRDITLLYGLRSETEHIYRDLVEQFPFTACQLFITPDRLKLSDIIAHMKPSSLVYISGGQLFVEDIRRGLEGNGIDRERIVFDYFDGYKEAEL